MNIFPKECIHCHTKLQWTQKKVDLWCPNEKCHGVGFERLDRFFTKIKVDDLSRGRLEVLSKHGIDTPLKIFQMTEAEISELDRFGPVLAKKLIENIKAVVKRTGLVDVMAASGIFQNESMGLSQDRLELVTSKLSQSEIQKGEIGKIKSKIINIKGVGPETISLFLEKLPEFQLFFNKLSAVVNIGKEAHISSTKLAGHQFVFSGYRDNDLERLIKENGGKIGTGITKATTYLFTAENHGKAQKAKEYIRQGISINIVHPSKADATVMGLMK